MASVRLDVVLVCFIGVFGDVQLENLHSWQDAFFWWSVTRQWSRWFNGLNV